MKSSTKISELRGMRTFVRGIQRILFAGSLLGGFLAFPAAITWAPGIALAVVEETIAPAEINRKATTMPEVTPVFLSVDLRDLEPATTWKPGDSIRLIPRRFHLTEKLIDTQLRAAPLEDATDSLLGQQTVALLTRAFSAPSLNFGGAAFTGVSPPDTVGDIGVSYYIQSINAGGGSIFTVYDKSDGSIAVGPLTMESLGVGAPGISNCSSGAGDPIVLYDELAGRWLLSEFSDLGNKLCVYISATGDPIAGGWHAYEFSAPQFPDYPKYAVWSDGYYVGTNEGAGPGVYVMDRTSMLTGSAATMQRFTVSGLGGFGFQMINPADIDGSTAPPGGSPALFLRHRDDESHNPGSSDPSKDFLEIFEFHVDFANSANSTVTGPISIDITDFDSNLCGLSSFSCIDQPGGGIGLDPLREVVMWRPQYRNKGSYEVLIGSHVTDVDGTDHAGIRWWELRKSTGGSWSLFQEGTFAPDAHSRWMSSIASDESGNIAVGYSAGSSTLSAGIRYTGRLQTDAPGTMTTGETTLIAGLGTHSNERWGDYSSMNVDPVDGCTFWYTHEYPLASGRWDTQIGSFKFDSCGTPGVALAATNLSQSLCIPNSLDPIEVTVTSIGGFTGSTTLSLPNLPAGFTGSFSPNPVTPTGQSTLSLSADASAGFGNRQIEILASTSGAASQSLSTDTEIYHRLPLFNSLANPADGVTETDLILAFKWNPASYFETYVLEIDDDPLFGSIDVSATGTQAGHVLTNPLLPLTTYSWRVRAINPCGETLVGPRQFTTGEVLSLCSAPAGSIPDGLPSSPLLDSIVVTGAGTVAGTEVSVDITHTWVGDLSVSLTHQDTGTSALLIDRPGSTGGGFGCDENDISVILADSATTAVEDQCDPLPPAISGTQSPNNPLSAFDGENIAGTWTLSVADNAGTDVGTLNSWCLNPTGVPEPGGMWLLTSGILFMCGERTLRRQRERKRRIDR